MNAATQANPHLVVLETIYYRGVQDQPEMVESKYQRDLQSDEQPYSRHLLLTEKWIHLDAGWIERPSLLLLKNPEPKFVVIPTDEERADAYAKVVEIGFVFSAARESPKMRTAFSPPRELLEPEGVFEVPVGESTRCNPMNMGLIMLRCRKGSVKCNLVIYPK